MDFKTIDRAADNIRILSAAMVERAKSGHPGGAMGGADFINILYTEYLNWDPDDPAWFNRDRFYLDPGHMSPMLYSALTLAGNYSIDEIKNFRQWGSPTPGHPERDIKRGVENTSGPLGQGHAMGLGAAIAERFLVARFGEWMAHKTYAYISDGGIQEEISQGVGRLAGHLGLSNFVMFFDSNEIQLSSCTSEVTSEDTAAKYRAWGWSVITINGNDQHQIREALDKAVSEKQRPTLIIGNTVMGKGAVDEKGNSFECQVATHGMPLSAAGASFEDTVKKLGGDPENPFVIFPEVDQYYKEVLDRKRAYAKSKKEQQAQWEKQNPDLAVKLSSYINDEIPALDWESIEHKADIPSRAASGVVLGEFGKKFDNMIVSSADLSNSDKTDGFLKQSSILKKDDFSGAFLQAGVAEFTMAAVMNGIASHGGVMAVCGTFFAFSDYMKPAVRLAALMGLPVMYVWTHDAFRVGEDGPTHQPIEQELQIRLLEKMANPEGKLSMLVFRPADPAETTIAWKIALENRDRPTALLLSRQKIKDLPSKPGSTRYDDALGVEKGAYTIVECEGKPDLVLVGNGSEVITLVESAAVLAQKGIATRVVSAVCEGLFNEQSQEYRESVIPFSAPVLGLTAGLPLNLKELTGPLGKVIGMERFGASAPFQVLDEKFGYTVENVVNQAQIYLKEYEKNLSRVSSVKQAAGS
ncbi:Transketolase [Chitinispirillum alkaliphilum]|nr:Transketolase [Chitinispirillum alkaliphilum]